MDRRKIGQGNFIYPDGDITALDVHVLKAANTHRSDVSFLTVGDESNSIIINSLNQWQQLTAWVKKGFDDLEG